MQENKQNTAYYLLLFLNIYLFINFQRQNIPSSNQINVGYLITKTIYKFLDFQYVNILKVFHFKYENFLLSRMIWISSLFINFISKTYKKIIEKITNIRLFLLSRTRYQKFTLYMVLVRDNYCINCYLSQVTRLIAIKINYNHTILFNFLTLARKRIFLLNSA